MEWLPLPRTWRGWVAALVLVAIAFTVYYLAFFPYLLRFYDQVLYSVTPPAQVGKGDNDLFMKVASPRHVGSFGNRWIHVTILNAGKETLQDVRVWLGSERLEGDDDKNAWLDSVGVPSLLKSPPGGELHFTKINSRETVWGRLPVYATGSFTGHVVIQVPQAQEPLMEVRDLRFKRSEARFLAHAFVENILLPPWSNGLLPGLAVFVGYLAERRKEELDDVRKEEHGPGREAKDPQRIGLLVLEGLRGLALFFAIVFAFIALPWCCSGSALFLLILFLFFLAGVFIGPRLMILRILPQLERRLKPQDGQRAEGSGLNTGQSGRWSGQSKFAQGLWGRIWRCCGAELMTSMVFFVGFSVVAHQGASTAPLIGLAALNLLVLRCLNVLSKELTQGPRRSTKRPSRGKRTPRTSSRRCCCEQRIQ